MNPNLKVIVDLSLELDLRRKEIDMLSKDRYALNYALAQLKAQAAEVAENVEAVRARKLPQKVLNQSAQELREAIEIAVEVLKGNAP